ncbi:MAG: MBL fold metallo-hydrolase [Rhizobiaceae bacterium]|nr:MBL fold metallo-hydrolase [Rhizobiaceae bacterium]
MSATLRLTILGCGSSPGVPRITGDWGACDPKEPKNRRRRCSALVQRITTEGTTNIVIDCGPDFREQMVDAGVRRLDAVVITHPHADHIHGLDDLRGYVLDQKSRIPVHADADSHNRLLDAFSYCYRKPPGSSYEPIVRHVGIVEGERFAIDGPGGAVDFLPFRQAHGRIHSLGFRCGPVAYCSDVSDFPDAAAASIRGAQHIVIDALQYTRHPSHLSLDQALDWIERLAVPQATLTHMHTPLDYGTMIERLPSHVRPAFDGLQLDFPVD